MALTNLQVKALLVVTAATEGEELDCEQYLEHMAELVEARAEGRALPSAFAPVLAHERLCANCREETEALGAAIDPAR